MRSSGMKSTPTQSVLWEKKSTSFPEGPSHPHMWIMAGAKGERASVINIDS